MKGHVQGMHVSFLRVGEGVRKGRWERGWVRFGCIRSRRLRSPGHPVDIDFLIERKYNGASRIIIS